MRYIVDFINSADQVDIDAYFENHGCEVIKVFSVFNKTCLVEAESAPPLSPLVESVIEDSSAPLKLLSIPTKTFPIDEDDNWWKLAVLSHVNLEQPTATIARSAMGVRVYCMDSGIDHSHPEFSGKDITLLHSVIPNDFSDTTGHGTSLASVIVGETCGITEASLKVVKIFHSGYSTLLSDLIEAFDAVMSDYLLGGDFLAVLNLSWIIEKNTYIEEKINTMINAGIVVIGSAGNDGRVVGDVTPAGMQNVVTVGSFGKDLTPSDFSNYTASDSEISFTEGETNHGAGLDCFAPGENIRVALVGGGYGFVMGTSISAAITSAIFALRIVSSGISWVSPLSSLFNPHSFLSSNYVRNILTMEGNFVNSPNAIPAADVVNLTDRVRNQKILPARENAKTSGWMFHKEFYPDATISGQNLPSWIYLEDNILVADVPEIDQPEVFEVVLSYTENDTPQSITYYIITLKEEMQVADLSEEIKIYFQSNGASQSCVDECVNTYGQSYTWCCICCGMEYKNTLGVYVGGYCAECQNFECSLQVC